MATGEGRLRHRKRDAGKGGGARGGGGGGGHGVDYPTCWRVRRTLARLEIGERNKDGGRPAGVAGGASNSTQQEGRRTGGEE